MTFSGILTLFFVLLFSALLGAMGVIALLGATLGDGIFDRRDWDLLAKGVRRSEHGPYLTIRPKK